MSDQILREPCITSVNKSSVSRTVARIEEKDTSKLWALVELYVLGLAGVEYKRDDRDAHKIIKFSTRSAGPS